MADRLSSVSAFFPCYNDAGSIATMVERVAGCLRVITSDFEVIVVDDGSSDDSVAILEAMAVRAPFLRIVRHPRNRGYGAALRSGFEASGKDFVFYTDGDGQYDPEELPVLVRAMRDGIGLVNGYKIRRSDPAHRVVIGRAYQLVARRLFEIQLRDVDCDFRLIRNEYLRRISLDFESGAIGVQLVRRLQDAGCRMVEAPVHHYPRLYGRSEFFRLRPVANLVSDLWRLWWQLRRERRCREAAMGDRSLGGEERGL
ncbi:MAG: glycosyltransferase family 2 protein [Dehalococcoidia bacterium]